MNLKINAAALLVAFFANVCLVPGHSWAGNFKDCTVAWSSLSTTTHCDSLPVHLTFQRKLRKGTYTIAGRIRAGYIVENSAVAFRGNILYFEGFDDSMQNHLPLFNRLALAGYRVIAFDYLGQGGSTGSINDTRIQDIPVIGLQVYKTYGRDLNMFPKPIILGWSAGALAGYYAATLDIPSRVVLISLPLSPKMSLRPKVTLSELTADQYTRWNPNPHVDPFQPLPVTAMEFFLNVDKAASYLQNKTVSRSIPGMVLLSGQNDHLVDNKKTESILGTDAPLFHIYEYKGALHEIDNEKPSIRQAAQSDILNFLNWNA